MHSRGQILHHTLQVCLQAEPNPQLVLSHRSNLFLVLRQPACTGRTFLCLQKHSIFVSRILITHIYWSPKIHNGLSRSNAYRGWLTAELLLLSFLSSHQWCTNHALRTTQRKTKLGWHQAVRIWKIELFFQVKQAQKFNHLSINPAVLSLLNAFIGSRPRWTSQCLKAHKMAQAHRIQWNYAAKDAYLAQGDWYDFNLGGFECYNVSDKNLDKRQKQEKKEGKKNDRNAEKERDCKYHWQQADWKQLSLADVFHSDQTESCGCLEITHIYHIFNHKLSVCLEAIRDLCSNKNFSHPGFVQKALSPGGTNVWVPGCHMEFVPPAVEGGLLFSQLLVPQSWRSCFQNLPFSRNQNAFIRRRKDEDGFVLSMWEL